MIKIDASRLTIGMELARPVFHKTGLRLLASKGTVINDYILRKLQELDTGEIYVKIYDYCAEEIRQVALEIPFINNIQDSSAKNAYFDAYIAYKDIINDIKNNQTLSLRIIKHTILNIINAINENKAIMMQLTQIKSLENYTVTHSINVTIFSLILGMASKISRTDLINLGIGAFLHDIGKIFISSEILNKPDKLTREEFEVVQGHTYIGYKKALKIAGIHQVIPRIILEHHERLDSSGYPNGKNDKDIHLYAQIVAVCDVYEALTSKHVYRSDFLPHEAIEYLFALSSDKKLNIDLIDIFLENISIYPFGLEVLLSNGSMARVVDVHQGMPLRPTVEIIGEECNIIDLINEPTILITRMFNIS